MIRDCKNTTEILSKNRNWTKNEHSYMTAKDYSNYPTNSPYQIKYVVIIIYNSSKKVCFTSILKYYVLCFVVERQRILSSWLSHNSWGQAQWTDTRLPEYLGSEESGGESCANKYCFNRIIMDRYNVAGNSLQHLCFESKLTPPRNLFKTLRKVVS